MEKKKVLCALGVSSEAGGDKTKMKKAVPRLTLPSEERQITLSFACYDFLKNFFRPKPAKPANPVPNRSIVAGSGTGAVGVLNLRSSNE